MNIDNKMYTCALCGKSYTNIIDRITCEQNCYAKQQEEEKRAAEAKKKEEQKARHDEVTKAIDGAFALLNKYVHDYGNYNYDGKNANSLDNILPSKFLRHFLF